jgi:hypothetical protein
VGLVRTENQIDLLLVEAKANEEELKSSCGAKERGGLLQIQNALNAARDAYGVPQNHDWLRPYYQFCNRLTVLHFLMLHGVGARLLFIYFCGDANPNANCPQTPADWEQPLQEMYAHVGLLGESPLEDRVHRMFLNVNGAQ